MLPADEPDNVIAEQRQALLEECVFDPIHSLSNLQVAFLLAFFSSVTKLKALACLR